jgi:long-subunit fatty acid transport protein
VPGLTLGAGIDLVPATVEIERALVFGDNGTGCDDSATRACAKLGGDAFGIGGRFGVMYHPPALKELRVGGMFRAPINFDFSGKGDFDIQAPFRDQLPPDGDIKTTLKLPMAIALGAAYNPLPELQLELDAVYQNWSRFQEIKIELPGGVTTVQPQDYGDTVTIRFGAEYALPKQHAAVRVGYIYDPTPIPSTTVSASLPDANRNDITAGGSYSFGDYDVHLGLLYVLPSEHRAALVPVATGEDLEAVLQACPASVWPGDACRQRSRGTGRLGRVRFATPAKVDEPGELGAGRSRRAPCWSGPCPPAGHRVRKRDVPDNDARDHAVLHVVRGLLRWHAPSRNGGARRVC